MSATLKVTLDHGNAMALANYARREVARIAALKRPGRRKTCDAILLQHYADSYLAADSVGSAI